jgi:ribonuclease-3 family protein
MADIFMENVINEVGKVSEKDVDELSPLVLAYVGDAVFELYVRTYLVSKGNSPVHALHKQSIHYVKAKAQSDIVHILIDHLTDEEKNVVRRGRNAKSNTIPKNADVTEYKYATGFESLLGYLYLKKDYPRLMHILSMSIMEHCADEKENTRKATNEKE